MFRRFLNFWIAGVLILWSTGCSRPHAENLSTTTQPAAGPKPLRIAAASDLQKVLPKLAERFQSREGVAATLTFDASGRIAEQIKAGAPFDIFLAANERFVNDLSAARLVVPESVHPYAVGTLVLCVHPKTGDGIQGLADLSKPAVSRIAIANPDYAPYGAAARQLLERAGPWESLQSKLVRAESVRQALAYTEKGDAEAAFVGLAVSAGSDVRRIELDPALYDPIVQSLGVVADSHQRDQAEAFCQFVLGDEGQTMLREAGFRPPPSRSPALAPAPGSTASKSR